MSGVEFTLVVVAFANFVTACIVYRMHRRLRETPWESLVVGDIVSITVSSDGRGHRGIVEFQNRGYSLTKIHPK